MDRALARFFELGRECFADLARGSTHTATESDRMMAASMQSSSDCHTNPAVPLRRVATVDLSDEHGTTLLMLACRGPMHHLLGPPASSGSVDSNMLARQLIARGASLDRADDEGRTALMMAVEECLSSGRAAALELVQLLLESGASVNQADNQGITALMRACGESRWLCVRSPPLVKLLLVYGASRMARDKQGLTVGDRVSCPRYPVCWVNADTLDAELEAYMWSGGLPSDPGHARFNDWFAATRLWVTPLHYLEDVLTPQRTRALLAAGHSVHACAEELYAPSPLDLAEALERDGCACAGSPAAIVLASWREALVALAMGLHPRLGKSSAIRHLGSVRDSTGCPLLLALIRDHLAEPVVVAGEVDSGEAYYADEIREFVQLNRYGDPIGPVELVNGIELTPQELFARHVRKRRFAR